MQTVAMQQEQALAASRRDHSHDNHDNHEAIVLQPWGYRPPLDGLRAVAVYLVVAFHAGLSAAEGGFVGVDLFFVLSGFLITNVLTHEAEAHGRIRLGRFYAARARRLVPAALLTIVGTAALMMLIKTVVARDVLVDDARASALWYANWHFIGQATDYFDTDIATSPYLHFWSLSIEEQFYVGFPLLLIGLAALGRRLQRPSVPLAGIVGLIVVSVAIGLLREAESLSRVYYGTDTRAYQLLSGAALAMILHHRRGRQSASAARIRLAGGAGSALMFGLLVLAASSALSLTPNRRGLLATAVVVTVLLGLELAPRSVVARGLAAKPMVELGRISYGTYLWHWPLIIAIKVLYPTLPAGVVFVLVVVTATSIASLSDRLVEQPIRSVVSQHLRWMLVAAAVALTVAAALLSSAILQRPASPSLLIHAANQPDTAYAPDRFRVYDGFEVPMDLPDPDDVARIAIDKPLLPQCGGNNLTACDEAGTGGRTVLLVGDSQAASIAPALKLLAAEHDFSLSIRLYQGCAWQTGLELENDSDCSDKDEFMADTRASHSVDLAIAFTIGRVWEGGDGYEPGTGSYEGLDGPELAVAATTDSSVELLGSAGEVLLIEPLPVPIRDPHECLLSSGAPTDCTVRYLPRERDREVLDLVSEQSAQVSNVNIDSLVCFQAGWCHVMEGEELIYHNQYHVHHEYFIKHRDTLWEILGASIRGD